MGKKENNKSKNKMSSQDIEVVKNKDNAKITDNVNSLKREIFKDNIFSEEGFINYVKCVKKVEDVKKDIKSIVNEENANTDNLNLIRESRIISASKQNYNTLNGIFFSIVLTFYPIVLDMLSKEVENINYYTFFFIGFLMTIIYVSIIYFHYKKPDEKRAAAYFWLETEIEKKLKIPKIQKNQKNRILLSN